MACVVTSEGVFVARMTLNLFASHRWKAKLLPALTVNAGTKPFNGCQVEFAVITIIVTVVIPFYKSYLWLQNQIGKKLSSKHRIGKAHN